MKHQTIEKGSFISKSDAVMLQAIAALLMLWHHLFGFPARISQSYVLVLDRFLPIETFLANFGNICIAMFAFSSGYGLRKRYLNSDKKIGILQNYRSCLTQLVKFFSRYWIVFFAFVPLGFALGKYNWDLKLFLNGIIGINSTYNSEWWYIIYYIRFLLLFPLVSLLFDSLQKISPLLLHGFMAVCLIAVALVPKHIAPYNFLRVLTCFLEGMYLVDSALFERIYNRLPKNTWLWLGLGVALFSGVFFLSHRGIADYWLVVILIFALMLAVKSHFAKWSPRPILMFIGKYSTYIWLTHTFFAYYFFQKLTYFPRYSWLIFLWCLALSIASGMVLDGLLGLIRKLIPSKH